jgi:hypothetical protein
MPEVPLEQAQEEIQHHAHGAMEKWIMGVALTAAILAALAAIAALLAEHHANEAIITRMDATDQWNYYQAKGIKAGVLSNKIELLPPGKEADPKDIKKLDEYKQQQEEISEKAKELQQESDMHLKRHFPLACALTMFQLAIAVSAISVLIRQKLFWFLSIAFGLGGAGFLLYGIVGRFV